MVKRKFTALFTWQERARNEELDCARCHRIGLMTVDHIVPHSIIENLGLNKEAYEHEWNFRYLCRACNTLKRDRLDFSDPQTLINLRRYIDLAEEVYSTQKSPISRTPLL